MCTCIHPTCTYIPPTCINLCSNHRRSTMSIIINNYYCGLVVVVWSQFLWIHDDDSKFYNFSIAALFIIIPYLLFLTLKKMCQPKQKNCYKNFLLKIFQDKRTF